MIREAMKDTLNILGLTVILAKDGEEAIKLYKQALAVGSAIDLVILDLTVPGGLGGQETLAHLLDLNPNIKAIVSSGYSENLVISEYERFGFKGVISKPFRIEELNAVIAKHLASKELTA